MAQWAVAGTTCVSSSSEARARSPLCALDCAVGYLLGPFCYSGPAEIVSYAEGNLLPSASFLLFYVGGIVVLCLSFSWARLCPYWRQFPVPIFLYGQRASVRLLLWFPLRHPLAATIIFISRWLIIVVDPLLTNVDYQRWFEYHNSNIVELQQRFVVACYTETNSWIEFYVAAGRRGVLFYANLGISIFFLPLYLSWMV